jgi:hypothetical protein
MDFAYVFGSLISSADETGNLSGNFLHRVVGAPGSCLVATLPEPSKSISSRRAELESLKLESELTGGRLLPLETSLEMEPVFFRPFAVPLLGTFSCALLYEPAPEDEAEFLVSSFNGASEIVGGLRFSEKWDPNEL